MIKKIKLKYQGSNIITVGLPSGFKKLYPRTEFEATEAEAEILLAKPEFIIVQEKAESKPVKKTAKKTHKKEKK